MSQKPIITIEYCTQCHWLLRAAYYAQELLTTFKDDIGGTLLKPGSGGIFEIYVDSKNIWSRKEKNGFPEIKELKQRIRDGIFPQKDLGHSDRNPVGPFK